MHTGQVNFLTFYNNNEGLNHELRIEKFLDQLKANKNIADWQTRQAEKCGNHDDLYICNQRYIKSSQKSA